MSATRKTAWQFDTPVPWADEVFRQILQFYLFECPTPGLSARGRDFELFGWEGRGPLIALTKKLRQSASENLVYKSCAKVEMAEAVSEVGILEEVDLTAEYVVFYKHRDSEVHSLFGHIRNAFAHGSFFIGEHSNEAVYVLEDDYHGMTARLILKASTLVSWAKIVRGTPEHLGDPAS